MRLHLVSDEDQSSERPKLGLGYLSSYLKKYLPETEITLSFSSDNLLADIQKNKPDIVGFSAMTHKFKQQSEKAKEIKEKTGLPIIIGGVHISLAPEALPKWIDVGVIGEGEETLKKLLEKYESTKELKNLDVPGIVFWEDEILIKTEPKKLIEPIDSIPSPDWDFLKIGKNGPGHIMTSRGCPYHCRFCEAGNLWQKYRYHSPSYVVSEIETIYKKYGRKELLIMDDLFFVDKNRLEGILKLLEDKSLTKKMRFEVIGRADLFNEEVAVLLKKMNVFAISFGMESGSEKILKYLKKETVTLEQIRKAVALAKKYQIEVLGTFMVGTPGETEQDINKTINFIKELDLDQVGVNVTTPFPGTELWEVAKKKGMVSGNNWDDRLWAMRDVTYQNLENKLLLTELPKKKFWNLAKKVFDLQDLTHRRRKNRQLFERFLSNRSATDFLKYLAHSLKRPKEALYNLKHDHFRSN